MSEDFYCTSAVVVMAPEVEPSEERFDTLLRRLHDLQYEDFIQVLNNKSVKKSSVFNFCF